LAANYTWDNPFQTTSKAGAQADVYASRQGLFVLTESGDGIQILNPEEFVPKAW